MRVAALSCATTTEIPPAEPPGRGKLCHCDSPRGRASLGMTRPPLCPRKNRIGPRHNDNSGGCRVKRASAPHEDALCNRPVFAAIVDFSTDSPPLEALLADVDRTALAAFARQLLSAGGATDPKPPSSPTVSFRRTCGGTIRTASCEFVLCRAGQGRRADPGATLTVEHENAEQLVCDGGWGFGQVSRAT